MSSSLFQYVNRHSSITSQLVSTFVFAFVAVRTPQQESEGELGAVRHKLDMLDRVDRVDIEVRVPEPQVQPSAEELVGSAVLLRLR